MNAPANNGSQASSVVSSILRVPSKTMDTPTGSGFPPHPHMEPDRPPGGTRRTGGVKTPRKVQWFDGDVGGAGSPSEASTRALDERGLNVRAKAFFVLFATMK